jgi:hypothetical protein
MKKIIFLFLCLMFLFGTAFAETSGKISVTTPNDSCAIFIDGVLEAYGSVRMDLAEGRHRVLVREASGRSIYDRFIYVTSESNDNIKIEPDVPKSAIPVPIPVTKEAVPEKKTIQLNSGFDFTYLYSQFQYQEPHVMEDNGILTGFGTSYTYRDISKFMLRGEYRYLYGLVAYDGGYVGGGSLKIKDIPDSLTESRLLAGFDVQISEDTILTPYTGFGYRYLNDNANTQNTAGYMREANYFYQPVGIELVAENNGDRIGFRVEQDVWIWGKQFSHFTDNDPRNDDMMNLQRKGGGFRASLIAEFDVYGATVKFEGYQISWDVPQSDVEVVYVVPYGESGWVEPENHSVETGLSFGIIF